MIEGELGARSACRLGGDLGRFVNICGEACKQMPFHKCSQDLGARRRFRELLGSRA